MLITRLILMIFDSLPLLLHADTLPPCRHHDLLLMLLPCYAVLRCPLPMPRARARKGAMRSTPSRGV